MLSHDHARRFLEMDKISFDPMSWFNAIDSAVPSVALQTGATVLTEVMAINNFFTECELALIAGPREWQMQFYSLAELQSET